jgi:hypothetical protein
MKTESSWPHSQEFATCPCLEPDQSNLCLRRTEGSVWFRGIVWSFVNSLVFYGEELPAPRPTPKLKDHPLSAVRDCLFNIFAATLQTWRQFLHPQPEDASCRGNRDPLNTVSCRGDTGPLNTVSCRGDRDPLNTVSCRGDRDPLIIQVPVIEMCHACLLSNGLSRVKLRYKRQVSSVKWRIQARSVVVSRISFVLVFIY